MHGCSRLDLFRRFSSLSPAFQVTHCFPGGCPWWFRAPDLLPHTGADRAHRPRQRIWFRLALLPPRPQRCGLTSLVTRCSALTWASCVACLPQAVREPMRPPDRPKGPGKSLTSPPTLVTVLLCLDQRSELMDVPFIRGRDVDWTGLCSQDLKRSGLVSLGPGSLLLQGAGSSEVMGFVGGRGTLDAWCRVLWPGCPCVSLLLFLVKCQH